MFRRMLVAISALSFSVFSSAQTPQAPPSFRLVLPKGPGAILIDNSNGWRFERFVLYTNPDGGKRPVVQLRNDQAGLIASYALDHAPGYYSASEDCRNDVLGGVVKNALGNATVRNKQNTARTIKSGQTLAVGSFFVEKQDGQPLAQQAVWGFFAQDHTCAYIHLSRTPARPGEERLLDAALDSFTYDPAYVPRPEDYAVLARLLPPGMAAAYGSAAPVHHTSANDLSFSPQSLSFALAEHPGFLSMDAPSLKVTELSAKPNGREFGIRADASDIRFEALGFLFLPDPAQPTAVACRDMMLKSEKSESAGGRKISSQSEMKSTSGVDIALVEYDQAKSPSPFGHVRRAFIAQGDLCADIQFFGADAGVTHLAEPMLQSLVFDPTRPPDYISKLRYASVLFAHKQYAPAARLYESALPLIPSGPQTLKWRRVAADQAAISYGMAGDLLQSRRVSEASIASDPENPISYYNLACADAESRDADAARRHLQQAFDRRANVLPGESLPDPTTDDSLLRLKSNKDFWTFVTSLPKSSRGDEQ